MSAAGKPTALAISARPVEPSFPDGFSARYHHFLHALSEHFAVDLVYVRRRAIAVGREAPDLPLCHYWLEEIPPELLDRDAAWARLARVVPFAFSRLPRRSRPRRSRSLTRAASTHPIALGITLHEEVAHLGLQLASSVPRITVLEEEPEPSKRRRASETRLWKYANSIEERRRSRLRQRVGRSAAAAVVIADQEAEWWASRCPARRFVTIPHGIDTEHFAPLATEFEFDVAVFGQIKWLPTDALLEFDRDMHQVARRAGRAIRVAYVGDATPGVADRLRADGSTVTGRVPDLRPYYARSRVVAVPLRSGAGVKTTLLEAWAMGRPVVASSDAARGLPARPGENILVGEDHRLGELALQLIEDTRSAEELGMAGRDTVARECSVARSGRLFADLCRELAG